MTLVVAFSRLVVASVLLLASRADAQADEFFALFPAAPTCTLDGKLPEDYSTPHTDPRDLEVKLSEFGMAKEDFIPETLVVVGGSSGIGYANACYWAAKGTRVFSLASTYPDEELGIVAPPERKYMTPIDCSFEDDIITIRYDITQDTGIGDMLKDKYGVETIDMLLLNAGRDLHGTLREWSATRMAMALNNNVFGLHQVWTELREMLNPDMALVLGASSVVSTTRFASRRLLYSISKRMVTELILGYAAEERGVQPNTHYAAVLHGDTKTNFGLTQISPNKITTACLDLYKRFGETSNSFLQVGGVHPTEVAERYHMMYAYTAAVKVLELDPVAIPQTLNIEPDETIIPNAVLEFNHHLVPAEVVNELCYAGYWTGIGDVLAASCFGQCPGLEFLEALINPRVDMMCECPVEEETDGKKTKKKGGKKKAKHESDENTVCVA